MRRCWRGKGRQAGGQVGGVRGRGSAHITGSIIGRERSLTESAASSLTERCVSTSLDPLQAAGDIFNFPPTSDLRNAPLPTYRYHTPAPLPFIQACSASHYLYLKCRSILTHQKHMSATHVRMCGQGAHGRVRARKHTSTAVPSNSLTFQFETQYVGSL